VLVDLVEGVPDADGNVGGQAEGKAALAERLPRMLCFNSQWLCLLRRATSEADLDEATVR
jgi:hypothetical protein